jgi:hypothetical protein
MHRAHALRCLHQDNPWILEKLRLPKSKRGAAVLETWLAAFHTIARYCDASPMRFVLLFPPGFGACHPWITFECISCRNIYRRVKWYSAWIDFLCDNVIDFYVRTQRLYLFPLKVDDVMPHMRVQQGRTGLHTADKPRKILRSTRSDILQCVLGTALTGACICMYVCTCTCMHAYIHTRSPVHCTLQQSLHGCVTSTSMASPCCAFLHVCCLVQVRSLCLSVSLSLSLSLSVPRSTLHVVHHQLFTYTIPCW